MYQVVWLRELRLVFGASTAANAAVLAIFMGGLGLGGLLLGRRADRHPHPLALYGMLELGVALSAAVSPLLVDAARAAYVALGGTAVLGATGGTAARLAMSAVVLGLPTFLMGGTLPAVVRAVERAGDPGRGRLGLLYALNTLGSVAGALLATFVAIELLGIRTTLAAAVGVNLAVAATAVAVGRRWPARTVASVSPTALTQPTASPALVLTAAGLSGFAFLLMELAWYRVLAPLLGGSSYSFGMILAVALLGIGLGGLAYGAWARGRRPTPLDFGLTAGLEAILLAIPLAMGDQFALMAAAIRPLGDAGFGSLMGVWALIAAAAILPGALVAGFQFPLLVGLLGKGDEAVGQQVGQAYAANTLGSIVGSLAGGFGLLPLLGAVGAWRLVVLLLAGLGAAGAIAGRKDRTRALGVALVVALALGLASRPGPTAAWRHSPIGAGRSDLASLSGVELEDRLREVRRATLWEVDGVESALALQSLTGHAFVIHGKIDGHVIGDAPTNLWLGLLPTLLHPDPTRVAVVGLGTGQTAGWAAAVREVESVDVIELEPAIRRVAEACSLSSRAPLDNPKVALHHGDAREWLMSTPRSFDVIISEPSNPYRAGIASLFSVEFYQAVDHRLGDDGLFLQWIQAYELSPETLATALATLHAVFPHLEIWEGASNGDLLVVAARAPLAHDAERLAARVETEPWRSGLAWGWRVRGLEGLTAAYVGDTRLARDLADGAPVNTDDHPVIEFGFAKHVGQELGVTVQSLRQRAEAGGWDRPPLDPAPNGWARLEARHTKAVAGRAPPGVPTGVSGPLRERMLARVAWVDGDLAGAASAWARQGLPPTAPLDLLVLGEAWAQAGDPRALAMADALRPLHPTESLLVEARHAAATQAPDRAVAALLDAFSSAASDPWVHPRALSRGLGLAVALPAQMGPQGPAAAAALIEPLLRPFAEGNLDELRRAAALRLAPTAGFEAWCQQAFGAMEPHPPFHLGLLQQRATCYAAMGDPLLTTANADIDRHQALQAAP